MWPVYSYTQKEVEMLQFSKSILYRDKFELRKTILDIYWLVAFSKQKGSHRESQKGKKVKKTIGPNNYWESLNKEL